jgi:hypothetical protein
MNCAGYKPNVDVILFFFWQSDYVFEESSMKLHYSTLFSCNVTAGICSFAMSEVTHTDVNRKGNLTRLFLYHKGEHTMKEVFKEIERREGENKENEK